MSSTTGPLRSDLVLNDHKPRGPIATPIKHSEEFIDEFNRIYQSIGLRIDRVEPTTIHRDKNVTGDSMIEIADDE